jgi:hypothetical protein
MRFFFYGTLMDPDLRALVIGRTAGIGIEPATLIGWRRRRAVGFAFPIAVPAPGRRIEGVLARGLDRAALRRLCRYEDDGYRLVKVAVRLARSGRSVPALLFTPMRGRFRGGRGTWSLARWQRREKRRQLPRLRAWLGRLGRPVNSG